MNAQGTQEWLLARAGKATASRFSDVLATIKKGEASTRAKYRLQLVTERLTGQPVEGYKNRAMEWGNETEPFARMAYEASRGVVVEEVGFMDHPEVPLCGASPDGLVGSDGMIEVKCPYESTVHVATLEANAAPSEHVAQMQGNLWVNGRAWCDFISFDPRMPEKLRLVVYRVMRDDAYIANLQREVQVFLGEVAAMHKRLMERP